MKLNTFTEFINESHPADKLKTNLRYQQLSDVHKKNTVKLDPHKQDDMHPFSLQQLQQHIEKGTEKAEKDIESTEQTIKDNKEIQAGDFVLHKHRQNLGVGAVQKIHNNKTHADIHFVDGLKSSLIDDDKQSTTDMHTMELKHLIPVVGTQG